MFKELQALGLDCRVYDRQGEEVELKQDLDDGVPVQNVTDDKAFTTVNDFGEETEGFGIENADGEEEANQQSESIFEDFDFSDSNDDYED